MLIHSWADHYHSGCSSIVLQKSFDINFAFIVSWQYFLVKRWQILYKLYKAIFNNRLLFDDDDDDNDDDDDDDDDDNDDDDDGR